MSSRLPLLGAACLASMAVLTAACDPSGFDLRPFTIDTRDADGRLTGALVAHEINGTWFAAGQATPGVFTFYPTHEYVGWVQVCPTGPAEAPERVDVRFRHEGLPPPEVIRTWDQPCPLVPAEPEPPARVQFTVIPVESSLGVATGTSSVGPDGTIAMGVPLEPSDLVAMTASRVVVQRGVSFDPAMPYRVDIDREGVEREPFAPTVPPGAPGETVTAAYRFRTWRGTQIADTGGGSAILVVPAALCQRGDSHTLEHSAVRGRGRRWIEIWSGDLALLDVPLAFAPTFEDVDATWDDDFELRWAGRPPGDAYLMSADVRQDGERSVHWNVAFDQEWLAIHDQDRDGVWSPPDMTAVRGWNRAWNLDPARRDFTTWTLGSYVVDYRDYLIDRFIAHGSDWSGSLGQAR